MKKALVVFSLVFCLSTFLYAAGQSAKPPAGKKTTSLVKREPPSRRKVYTPPSLPKKIVRSKGAVPLKEWTILYYLDADNNLEPDMLDDVNEMERIGSTDNVNLVVLLDRTPDYDNRDGNWVNNRLNFLTRDTDEQKITSKVLDDLKEMDMADPQTLVNFVAFGLQNFPAKHYAVVLGDHGGTWMSSLNDETNNEGGLRLAGLISALDSLKKAGAPTIDLMVFDMCLMSQVEVMDAISPYVSYGVASEELEPGSGYPNHRVLYQLTKNPGMAPRDLAQVMVQEWSASYNEAGEDTVTSAATDLSRIKDVVAAINDLAAALMKAPPEVSAAVARSRASAQHFPGNTEDDLNSYDLGDFVSLLSQQPEAASLKPQLDRVAAAVKAAVLKHEEGAAHQGATGLAIYFPFDKKVDETYKTVPLTKTQWDEYLLTGGGQAAAATADVKIASPDPATPHPMGSGIQVTATVSGSPVSVHASIGLVDEDGSISLVSDEEVMSPGAKTDADGSYVPVWKDGVQFTYSIKPQVTAMTDGKRVSMAPLFAMSPGSRFVQGYASYHSKMGDMQVAPVFDTKSGQLETVFCFSEKGTDAPMEVHPVKGEELVFYQPSYTGENKEQRYRPTPALTTSGSGRSGAAPAFKLIKTALPKGEYVFVLTAYGPDGDPSGYDSFQITADGQGASPQATYPDYDYPTVSYDDIEYVDLPQIIPAADYEQCEGTWDDYDVMEQYEDDDFDADDLEYLDDVELDEEDLEFDEQDWSDEFEDEEEEGEVEEDHDETDHDEDVDEDEDEDEDENEDNVQDDDQDQDDDDGDVEDDSDHDDDHDDDEMQSDDDDHDDDADDEDDDDSDDDDNRR